MTYGSITPNQQRYARCPISFNNFDDTTVVLQIIGCGHYFNPHSLRTHLSTQDTCPYCRFNIRNSLIHVVGTGINTDISSNVPDVSGNVPDASGIVPDASGNAVSGAMATDPSGIEQRTLGTQITSTINNGITNARNAEVFYHIANPNG